MTLYSILFSRLLLYSHCHEVPDQRPDFPERQKQSRPSQIHFLILGTERDYVSQSLLQLGYSQDATKT